jgi:hypothetical protein
MIVTLKEAQAKYGAIEGGIWKREAEFCKIIQIPSPIAENWINAATGKPTYKVYGNRDLEEPLLRALNTLLVDGFLTKLRTFDGCFMIRDVRGEPGAPSVHSYALAIDMNAKENALGTVGNMDPRLVQAFTKQGFSWGGDFRRKDPMHFSYAWE